MLLQQSIPTPDQPIVVVNDQVQEVVDMTFKMMDVSPRDNQISEREF